MDIESFLTVDFKILVPILYCIGLYLKKSKLSDKFIPLVLSGFSVIMCFIFYFSTQNYNIYDVIFKSVTQGILYTAFSVYINQIKKQLLDKEK